MPVTVSGILRDSGGNPAANDVIKFYTKQGFNGALPSATLEITTSSTGAYDFELSVGVHLLSVQYNDVLTKVGKVTVTSDMPSPQTLDSLLAFEEPLLPDEIIIVQGLVAEANEAANRAEAAATSVEGIEDEVESDRAEVAANAQQVADDKQAVAFAAAQVDQDKNDVTSMTDQVTSMRDEVESDRAEVSANAVDVNSKAIQVTNDAQDAAESSLLSQMWAVGSNPSNGTPSDTNNAEYWSNRAYQLATGALKYGNQFTPTPGTPYPPVTESDTMYMVNFSDPNGSFTYTDGDLAGTTVINGNAIIYNVQQSGNKYEAQSYVFTGVATVNGKSPDGANNVDITASDVGAYSTVEVDTALEGKQDASTASKLVEPGSAIDVPVIATIAELPNYPTKSMMAYVTEVATVLVFNPESGEWDNFAERIGGLEEEVDALQQENTEQQEELDQGKQIYHKEVTPNVGTSTSGENRFVKFSRVGNMVEFSIDITLTSAQSNVDLLDSYPSGYTPMSSGTFLSRTFNTSDDKIPYLWLNTSNRRLFNFASGRHEIQGTYITNDPYPVGDEV